MSETRSRDEINGDDQSQNQSSNSSSNSAPQFAPPPPGGLSDSAHDLINGLWNQDFDEPIDDQAALRWRRALLRLSETFLDAAEERRDLSPILLGALHNALEELLIRGNEEDLMALEDWLGHEAPPPPPIQDAVSEAARAIFSGTERRNSSDRRAGLERRQGDRRQNAHGRRASDSRPSAP